jgi:UDP-N-acetylglucosamine 1-carboxyvinyltransferase
VVTDRIELGTYMLVPAICGGEVECIGGTLDLVQSFAEKLDAAGVSVTQTNRGLKVARKNGRVRAVDVMTEPFPGFPTDLQAQSMALATQAEGLTTICETVFENRFQHAAELARMGADIRLDGRYARVHGRTPLSGATVMATDLRASACLVLAGLVAEGETIVDRIYHLDRGYEAMEAKLNALGARVTRSPGGNS